ncbi:hypothetical protein O3P69_009520 [Scylla paramamosain]|uniref:Uncharacterized protein n=1 Tax=Scylla paramamosain TaxID=85552 RepID=A0AAW0SUB4_SCYPA
MSVDIQISSEKSASVTKFQDAEILVPDVRGRVSGPLTTAEYVTPWSRVFPLFIDAAARTDLKAQPARVPPPQTTFDSFPLSPLLLVVLLLFLLASHPLLSLLLLLLLTTRHQPLTR